MNAVLKKLQYKGQSPICIINMPESFAEIISDIDAEISMECTGNVDYQWIIVFVSTKKQVLEIVSRLGITSSSDPIIWFAYPKGTSKRYKSEINRDKGWQPLGDIGLEPVSQVAIDEDWTALRFRNVSSIKTLKRSSLGAISKEGKARTQKK